MIDRATVERDARAEWERDPQVRAEFGDVERYVAYRCAAANGSVRVLGSTVGADGELTPRGSAVVR